VKRVLVGGPWSFEQNLLILSKIQPDIPPIAMPLDTAEFWVQLHDLPLGFFSERAAKAIGNFIGEYVCIDEAAFHGWWKSFIRIRVRININTPLVSQMRVRKNGGDWSWINFRYERLPTFCFTCGLIGHSENYCPKPFDDPNLPSLKLFGPWLRAPVRRPSPVTGNRWVVHLEQPDHNATTNPSCQSHDAEGGTTAEHGLVRKVVQSTPSPMAQHVATTSGTLHTSNGNARTDVFVEQMDIQSANDGLVYTDPKRKRSELDGPPTIPHTAVFDLNGPDFCPKNLQRAGPVPQASPEQ